eukprot:scaffold110467_cov65-Attheya_sp.AAC.1
MAEPTALRSHDNQPFRDQLGRVVCSTLAYGTSTIIASLPSRTGSTAGLVSLCHRMDALTAAGGPCQEECI